VRQQAATGSQIARQLFSGRTVQTEAVAALFEQPPGFYAIEAAWSALSAAPAPLVIRVDKQKEKLEWF
jgi:hypothetical protein